MSTRSEQGPSFDVPRNERLNPTAKEVVAHNFLPQIDVAAEVMYRALWEQYREAFESQFTEQQQPQPVQARVANVMINATHQEQLNDVISGVGQGAMQQISPYEQVEVPYNRVLTDLQAEMHDPAAATDNLMAEIDGFRQLAQPPLESVNG